MPKLKILVTEDEGIVALDLKNTLERLGYSVPVIASSGAEAIKAAEETHPDLVLMDINLVGDMDGIEAAEQIRDRFDIPVIFLTAFADDQMVERAQKVEPYGYIIKPLKEDRELRITIEMALHKREMELELKRYRDHLEEMVEERAAALEKANEQLLQSQKMEAVGRLAGGVAHDFNNLLTVILGCSERELATQPSGDTSSASFRDIHEAAERASGLTQQLLSFSLRQTTEPKAINLNDPLVKMDRMLRRLLSDEIELATIPETGLELVEIDPGQIEQVILNLVVNAGDAMPSGGKLTIGTKRVTLTEDYVLQHPEASPGPHVMLSFSDSGHGMTDEVMDRIFEPFFSTKEEGSGTGLGLATCYGIVRQSGGHINVSSQEGVGSTFQVYLPCIEGVGIAPNQEEESSDMPSGDETVLLVEDEPLVRKLASRTLSELGYTVLEAANGVEAESLAVECTGPIDLLLADVVMPKMGGAELARQLRESGHNIPVLLMSGYVDTGSDVAGQLRNGASFLQKPFTRGDLARKVRDVLGSSNPSLEENPAVSAGR
jgi:signal transduction histidine kinase